MLFQNVALLALGTISCIATYIPRRANDAVSSRQLTKEKIIAREGLKRDRRARGILAPRTSSVVYPKCESASTAGYARFANLDYYGNDWSTYNAKTEAQCIDTCKTTPGCLGVFYWPNQNLGCYLKTSNRNSAGLQSSSASRNTGAATVLQGSCQELSSFMTPAQMSVCCDTTDLYPTCTSPCNVGSFQARFLNYDYYNYDFGGNPVSLASETACIQRCNSMGASCVAVFWWQAHSQCYLKHGPLTSSTILNTSSGSKEVGSAASIPGTCNMLAASLSLSSTIMASCCNVR